LCLCLFYALLYNPALLLTVCIEFAVYYPTPASLSFFFLLGGGMARGRVTITMPRLILARATCRLSDRQRASGNRIRQGTPELRRAMWVGGCLVSKRPADATLRWYLARVHVRPVAVHNGVGKGRSGVKLWVQWIPGSSVPLSFGPAHMSPCSLAQCKSTMRFN
jgi:hypothetical protein